METNKLPEDFKAKWVAALRSGEYRQGNSVLWDKDNDSYCCLGVAGVLCGIKKEVLNGKSWFHHLSIDLAAVPEMLRPQALTDNTEAETLASLNDGRDGKGPRTFAAIASYIEEHL